MLQKKKKDGWMEEKERRKEGRKERRKERFYFLALPRMDKGGATTGFRFVSDLSVPDPSFPPATCLSQSVPSHMFCSDP
jgi:hypothetical protein